MRSAHSQDITDRIRDAASLASVVRMYVRLKPGGTNRLIGLCPFHKEKSPSFGVETDKGFWKCFGCGLGGDVFSFVERVERVSFLGARRILAERYGIEIEDRPQTRPEALAERRQRAYAEQLASEITLWWRYVRDRYQFRFDLLAAVAFAASDRDDEPTYQRYARRAWMWGKIIRKLDAQSPAQELSRYKRVRERRDVAAIVGIHRDAARDAEATWARIVAAAPRMTEEQCWLAAAAVFSRDAAIAGDVLRVQVAA